MPAIAPGADFITTNATATSARSAATRSAAARTDADQTRTDDASRARSDFDTLVGLETPRETPVPTRNKHDAAGEQTSAKGQDKMAAMPGAASGPATEANAGQTASPNTGQSTDQTSGQDAAPNAGQTSGQGAGLDSQSSATAGQQQPGKVPVAGPANAVPAPAPIDANLGSASLARPDFAAAGQGSGEAPNPTAPGHMAAGGWTSQGRPEFVGRIDAGGTGNAAGAQANAQGTAGVAAANSANTRDNAAPAMAPAVAAQTGTTTASDDTAAQANPDAHAAGKSSKPPVMDSLPAGSVTAQPQAATTATATAAPAAMPATTGEETAKLTAAATTSATAGAAQSQTAETAAAPAAGRFAQARQGVDERDGSLAAVRSKGKTAAGAAGQAGAKSQAAGASSQPQPGATSGAATPPNTPTVSRELPASPPPPPPTAVPIPLAGEAVRAPAISLDPALTATATTDTSSVAGRSSAGSAAEAGTNPAARFTAHTANQLAAQISQRHANGSRVFGIRLDPAELGRVDIRLELSRTNRVHATLTVERGDTLAEMQRSARDLERALNDAGLDLAEDGLTFELSEGNGDEQFAGTGPGDNFNIYEQDDDGAQELNVEIETGPADAYGFRLSRRDSVDLRV